MTKIVHSISNNKIDVSITDGITVKVYTQPASGGGGGSFDCTDIAPCIHAATNKITPVNADEVGIWDSITGLLNRLSWANIKVTLKTYFDTLYITAAQLAIALGSYLTTAAHNAITTTPHVTDAEKITWNGKLSAALPEEISLQDINTGIAATTYTLVLAAKYACTINELSIIAGDGTATAAVQIDGVSVTGISAVAVSNVIATATATALNSVAVGNKITLVITSPTALDNLQATLKTTRI
jgi:hypothetical protein